MVRGRIKGLTVAIGETKDKLKTLKTASEQAITKGRTRRYRDPGVHIPA